MKSLGIDGAWIEDRAGHQDDRGSFHEWFRAAAFEDTVGHGFDLRQANCVVSAKGVLRGMHFTSGTPGQAKYFTCLRGSVTAAVVDIRTGSPTYGQWRTAELDDTNRAVLYVAPDLAFGFMSQADESLAVYLCSAPFDPQREHGLHPLDPEVGIQWSDTVTPILSARDANAPSLAEVRRAGLLPVHSG